jgi:hypothetical protein
MASVLITITGVDESRRAFNEAKDNFNGLSSAAKGLAPAIAPIAAAATSAIVQLGSAIGGAAVAAGVFTAAAIPQLNAMKENGELATKVADAEEEAARKKYLADKLAAEGSELAGDAAKAADAAQLASIDAMEEYKRATKDLPKGTADAALSFAKLKTAFKDWSDSLAGHTMPVFTQGMDILRKMLPSFTPLVKSTSKVFKELLDKLEKKVDSKGFDEFMKKLTSWAETGLRATIDGIGKLVTTIGGFVTSDGFKEFLAYGEEQGPVVVEIFKDLAEFVGKFIEAAGPLAGLSFAALQFLADALNAIPQELLEILAPTLMAIVVALKAWQLWTLAAAGAQVLLNMAMYGFPLTWIIGAVVGIIAIIVALWFKCEGFREVVKAVWEAIKGFFIDAWEFIRDDVFKPMGKWFTETVPKWARDMGEKIGEAWTGVKEGVKAALDWIANFFMTWTGANFLIQHWDSIKEGARKGVNKIKEYWDDFIGFFRKLPSRIANAASGMWNSIKTGFKSAINGIIGAWNNLSFSIGGGSIMGVDIPKVTLSTPNIPYMARGGISSGGLAMVGERGRELVNLPDGSHVRTNADTERLMRGNGMLGRPIHLVIQIGDKELGELVIDPVRGAVRRRGGNVQAVLGR